RVLRLALLVWRPLLLAVLGRLLLRIATGLGVGLLLRVGLLLVGVHVVRAGGRRVRRVGTGRTAANVVRPGLAATDRIRTGLTPADLVRPGRRWVDGVRTGLDGLVLAGRLPAL